MSTDVLAPDTWDTLRAAAFAAHGRDWAEAARCWERYRETFPDDVDGFFFGTIALRDSGQLAEADRLVSRALPMFPEQPALFVEHGLVALVMRDWPEARRRFAAVRRQFPDVLAGYVRGAEVAHNQGAHQEALDLMGAGVRRAPDDRSLLTDYAHLSERLGDLGRMAQAWREHRERYGEEEAFIGEARGLGEAGRWEAAEAVLREAQAAFPASLAPLINLARLASRRADWPEAHRQWSALRHEASVADEAASRIRDAERFLHPDGVVRGRASAPAGAVMGQTLDALLSRRWTMRFNSGQLLGEGIRFGENGELLNYYSEARWWAVRENCICLFEDAGHVMTKLTAVELGDDGRLRMSGRDWIHLGDDSSYVLEEQRPTIKAVMDAFESIGDNCEFGLVQRFYRSEPIGLLRFNYNSAAKLIDGLSTRFAALDHPDCAQVERMEDGELVGTVAAYGFRYHTHRWEADIDIPAFQRGEATRLRYLADILLENIEDANKVFVRKGERGEDLATVLQLHDCLRRIGPAATLFWVTEADEGHASGTVETIAPGLLRGWVERLAPGHAAARCMFDAWAVLCSNAHRLLFPEAWG